MLLSVCDELDAGLDRAHEVDLAALNDDELETALDRCRARRAREEALDAKLVAEWDRRRIWARHGARSAPAYLARRHRLPIQTCRQPVRMARSLQPLPAVQAALAAGAIETSHVRRILRVDNRRTHDALVQDQVEITRWAMTAPWRVLCRRLQDWLDEHDPDGATIDDTATRRLHCSRTLDDWWAIDGWLDPIRGSIVASELDRLERLLFEADWRDARDRLGYDPILNDLARTPDQRRADALVLMAERSAMQRSDGRGGRPRPRPLFTVLIDYRSFQKVCELTNGIQLRPGQLAPYLDHALVERLVFDGATRAIGISRQRTFRGAVRKAVEARDRQCVEPYCEEPIDACQVDHVVPAARGGETSQDNGALLCPTHNRRKGDRAPPGADAA